MSTDPCATTRRDQTAGLLRRISRALREPDDEAWLDLDLSTAQLKVLFSLAYRGPATVGALALAIHVKLPSVSATIDRLVRAGYAERLADPNDRRVVINQITPEGGALVDRLREARRLRVEQALDGLSAIDLDLLHQGLQALATAMQLSAPPPAGSASEPITAPAEVLAV